MDDQVKNFLMARAVPWLKSLVNSWDPRRGAVQRIYLRHLRADGTPSSDVHVANLPAYSGERDVPSAADIENIADDLVTAAVNDAEGLGSGLQRYALFAYCEKDPTSPLRHPMKVSGGSAFSSRGGSDEFGVGAVEDSETPDARGLTAQHMRHTEAMMKHTVFMAGQNMRIALEQNTMLAGQVNELLKQIPLLIQGYQTVLDNKQARDLAQQKQKVWTENVGEFADMLKILFPHAINRITGKNILPTKSSPEEMELIAFFQTLTPEQLDGIRSRLKPEQTLALIGLFERFREKHGEKNLVPTGEANGHNGSNGATPAHPQTFQLPGLAPHVADTLRKLAFEVELIDISSLRTDAPEKTVRAIEETFRKAAEAQRGGAS